MRFGESKNAVIWLMVIFYYTLYCLDSFIATNVDNFLFHVILRKVIFSMKYTIIDKKTDKFVELRIRNIPHRRETINIL